MSVTIHQVARAIRETARDAGTSGVDFHDALAVVLVANSPTLCAMIANRINGPAAIEEYARAIGCEVTETAIVCLTPEQGRQLDAYAASIREPHK